MSDSVRLPGPDYDAVLLLGIAAAFAFWFSVKRRVGNNSPADADLLSEVEEFDRRLAQRKNDAKA